MLFSTFTDAAKTFEDTLFFYIFFFFSRKFGNDIFP